MDGQFQALIRRITGPGQPAPTEEEVLFLLRGRGDDLKVLYEAADRVRRDNVGDEVYLRGIIEFSNYCRRSCDYCGIRGPNRKIQRYRMGMEEIVQTACEVGQSGATTVVLQSGEDPWFTAERLSEIIRNIRRQAGVAVTLSVGERSFDELVQFREAGCDRYLLRFETSDRTLFDRIHPDDVLDERVQCVRDLRRAGLQAGSGFMIGLPGGDLVTLARDILFTTGLDLDMIGCGPYLSHPDTPLGGGAVLEDRELYFMTIAILRLLNPKAHIPATTAFDALCAGGRDRVLAIGANVFMPNFTPRKYRALYQLYPGKPCVDEDGGECATCAEQRVGRMGRPIGKGPGHSFRENIKNNSQ